MIVSCGFHGNGCEFESRRIRWFSNGSGGWSEGNMRRVYSLHYTKRANIHDENLFELRRTRVNSRGLSYEDFTVILKDP